MPDISDRIRDFASSIPAPVIQSLIGGVAGAGLGAGASYLANRGRQVDPDLSTAERLRPLMLGAALGGTAGAAIPLGMGAISGQLGGEDGFSPLNAISAPIISGLKNHIPAAIGIGAGAHQLTRLPWLGNLTNIGLPPVEFDNSLPHDQRIRPGTRDAQGLDVPSNSTSSPDLQRAHRIQVAAQGFEGDLAGHQLSPISQGIDAAAKVPSAISKARSVLANRQAGESTSSLYLRAARVFGETAKKNIGFIGSEMKDVAMANVETRLSPMLENPTKSMRFGDEMIQILNRLGVKHKMLTTGKGLALAGGLAGAGLIGDQLIYGRND